MNINKAIKGGSLLGCLLALSKVYESNLTADAAIAGLPLENGILTPSNFERAAKRAGLACKFYKSNLREINQNLLPAVLLLKDNNACIIHSVDLTNQVAKITYPELPDSVVEINLGDLTENYSGQIIYARPNFRFDQRAPEIKKLKHRHWFWGVLLENRKIYRDILIASFLINLFALTMPLFVMNIYDRVVPNHATETLWVLAIGAFVVFTSDLMLRLMRTWFVDLGASRADVKLSSMIMERTIGMQLKNRPASAGSFANQIQSFQSVRTFMGSMTVTALIDLPFVFVFITIVAIINWVMILPVLIGATLILIYAFMAQEKLRTLSESSMRAEAMRSSTLIESISNLETLKSFGAESKIQRIWEKSTIFLSRVSAQTKLISGSITSGAQWTQHTVGVSLIIIGVYQIIQGNLSQGGLIACYMIASRAMAPITQTAGLIGQYHSSATALKSLNEIMERPIERPADKSYISKPLLLGDIEFKNVTFRYPDEQRDAIANVNFKIKSGEHIAILGRNGSGKSTIQKLILGLYQADNGSIIVDGVDQKQIDPAELRRQIGIVPQDVSLFFGTLKENIITSNPQAEDEQIIKAANLAGLMPFINSHPDGLDMRVGEGGKLLSGGQRQSVAIARALINDPPIFLLDEPSGALDHSSEEMIKRNLANISNNKTMIIVTHRSALLTLVDRIIVMDGGKVVADGNKDEVMKALAQRSSNSSKKTPEVSKG